MLILIIKEMVSVKDYRINNRVFYYMYIGMVTLDGYKTKNHFFFIFRNSYSRGL